MNSPPGNNSSATKRLAIIGFGDIAGRLAALLGADDWCLKGLSRSKKTSSHAKLYRGDANSIRDITPLLADRPDQLLVTLTPDERSAGGYDSTYVTTAQALIQACKALDIAPHIIFVSSTSVYGQDDGSLVDEASDTLPLKFNGQTLLKAEELLKASGMPLSILRFSGIYGRSPRPLKGLLRSDDPGFLPRRWGNRIHISDAVGVIEFVLRVFEAKNAPLGTLVASDLRPAQDGVIENWVREQLKLPPLTFEGAAPESGKRCKSELLQSLGYRFKVKSFAEGYLEGR